MIEESPMKPLVWYMLKEGGFILSIEALNRYDENFFQQFVNSWED